jgi:hypothetical protein
MSRLLGKDLVALSVLAFAISGTCSGLIWRTQTDVSVWLVPLVFGLPLMMLCRRRERAPDWLWLVVSLIIWLAIIFPGLYVVLALDRIGIVILGIVGALAFAGGFSLLIRRIRGMELALLAGAGLVGGVVFAAAGPTVDQSWRSGGYYPSPLGFAAWQVAVGTVLVWMASRGE